jgi:hypothetical protein
MLRAFDDGHVVTKQKVMAWPEDDILLRTVPPKGPRKARSGKLGVGVLRGQNWLRRAINQHPGLG